MMKWLKIILISLMLCGCSYSKPPKKSNTHTVRVTYYWPGSGGQIGNITSTGKPAKHYQTCAVDPKIFPYGSKIHIHEKNKTFIANDTGAWIKKRVAAKKMGKDVPVIDIFVKSESEAKRLIKKYPHFMTITVKDEHKKE